MRRFVHKAIGIGVPSIGGLVTGVAALGGETVRASIWSAITAVWHDPVSLALTIAGCAALAFLWAWTGHDDKGGDAPLQTTYGPHSPAIAAGDHATIVFHPPSAETQPMKSRYGSAHLHPSGNGVSDALEQAKYDFFTRKSEPKRDTKMSDAFAYLCTGQWGETLFDVVKDGRGRGDLLPHVRQLAFDGRVMVWGRLTLSDIFRQMPTEYWGNHSIDWFSLLKADGATSEGYPNEKQGPFYHDLMVSKLQFEKEYPIAG